MIGVNFFIPCLLVTYEFLFVFSNEKSLYENIWVRYKCLSVSIIFSAIWFFSVQVFRKKEIKEEAKTKLHSDRFSKTYVSPCGFVFLRLVHVFSSFILFDCLLKNSVNLRYKPFYLALIVNPYPNNQARAKF